VTSIQGLKNKAAIKSINAQLKQTTYSTGPASNNGGSSWQAPTQIWSEAASTGPA
jgi:hypothetical protein